MNTYIYFVYRVLLINKHRVSRDRKFNTRNFTTELFLLDTQNRNSMCVLPSQCVTFPPIREKKNQYWKISENRNIVIRKWTFLLFLLQIDSSI